MNDVTQVDCVKGMRRLTAESVDCIITDPPFGCNATLKGEYVDDEAAVRPLIVKWLKEMRRRFVLFEKNGKYARLARQRIEGWDVWGNQVPDEMQKVIL